MVKKEGEKIEVEKLETKEVTELKLSKEDFKRIVEMEENILDNRKYLVKLNELVDSLQDRVKIILEDKE